MVVGLVFQEYHRGRMGKNYCVSIEPELEDVSFG